MSFKMRNEQLPITSFFGSNSDKSKRRKSAPTKKRKRDETDDEGEPPQSSRNLTKQSSTGSVGTTKKGKGRATAQTPVTPMTELRKKSSMSEVKKTSSIGSNADLIDLTRKSNKPSAKATTLTTPAHPRLATNNGRTMNRLAKEDRPKHLMTPPATVGKAGPRPHPMLGHFTPNFGVTPKVAAGEVPDAPSSPQTSPVRRPLLKAAVTGLPTPGSSAPRSKRPRPGNATAATKERLRNRSLLHEEADSPDSSPILPFKPLSSLKDDVFAPTTEITPPKQKPDPPLSPAMKPASAAKFKTPSLPDHVIYHTGFSNESAVPTSQTQDLREYFPSPPRPRGARVSASPQSIRILGKSPVKISPKRLAHDFASVIEDSENGEELVGTSQSQEVELRIPADWTPHSACTTDDDFVLKMNHLLRTPSKAISQRYEQFVSPIRTPIIVSAVLSPSRAHRDEQSISSSSRFAGRSSPAKYVYSQFYDAGAPEHRSSPLCSTQTPTKPQSLKLFETQTLSPNIPRSFEEWRLNYNNQLDSDSATEPESDDMALLDFKQQQQAVNANDVDDVQDSPSQRKTPRNSTAFKALAESPDARGSPRLRSPDLSQVPDALASSLTQDSSDYSQSLEPTPLREFLDMVEGDGTYPDDFPESWRE